MALAREVNDGLRALFLPQPDARGSAGDGGSSARGGTASGKLYLPNGTPSPSRQSAHAAKSSSSRRATQSSTAAGIRVYATQSYCQPGPARGVAPAPFL
jgi:hypothetical protein